MREPETDEDQAAVEYCRKSMQDTIDSVDWEAGSVGDMLGSTGLPQEARQVYADDLRELGSFEISLPDAIIRRFPAFMRSTVLRHYVYRHKDGTAYVVHHPRRIELIKRGVVTLHAFVKPPDN